MEAEDTQPADPPKAVVKHYRPQDAVSHEDILFRLEDLKDDLTKRTDAFGAKLDKHLVEAAEDHAVLKEHSRTIQMLHDTLYKGSERAPALIVFMGGLAEWTKEVNKQLLHGSWALFAAFLFLLVFMLYIVFVLSSLPKTVALATFLHFAQLT